VQLLDGVGDRHRGGGGTVILDCPQHIVHHFFGEEWPRGDVILLHDAARELAWRVSPPSNTREGSTPKN